MQLSNQLIDLPTLEKIINRAPLTVSPETSIRDVVALMNGDLSNRCALTDVDLSLDFGGLVQDQNSCALVIQDSRLVGVFTERDVVRLTAAGIDFASIPVSDVMAHPVITLTQSNAHNLLNILSLLQQYRIRHLPILNGQDHLVGIVTPSSIRQVLQPANLLKMRHVAEVMSSPVVHASLDASVLTLAQLMAQHNISCVVIVAEQECLEEFSPLRPLGIITERDIVQFQMLELDLAQVQAHEVMSTPLFCLHPGDSLWVAHQEMQKRYVRRLVVVGDQEELLGVVTQSSFLQVFDPLEMSSTIQILQKQIHERQKVEEALRKSEQRYAVLAQVAPVGLFHTNAQGHCHYVNAQWCAIAGLQVDEALGEGWVQALHPEDRDRVFTEWQRATQLNTLFQAEYRFSRSDRVTRWVFGQAVAEKDTTGNVIGYVGTITDITDRKLAEEALKQSQERLELAQRVGKIGTFEWNLQTGKVTWTAELEALYGLPSGGFGGYYDQWAQALHPEDRPRLEQEVQQVLAENQTLDAEFRILWPDGSVRWLLAKAQVFQDPDGKPLRMIGVNIAFPELVRYN